MSGWKKALVALAVVLGILVALVWFFPARWAVALVASRLRGVQLREVSGLIWSGRVGSLASAHGDPLGELHWRLSRRLLLGQVQLHVQLDGPVAELTGDVSRSGKDIIWRHVSGRIRLAQLPRQPGTPWGAPTGVLVLQIPQATLRAGWPMSLVATAQWRQAGVQTPQGVVALGQIEASAHGSNGVIDSAWHDTGKGPLQVTGKLQLSPLGWRVTAALRPRSDDSALRQWLARLGQADAQGTIHIQHGAGLGATFPSSGVAR